MRRLSDQIERALTASAREHLAQQLAWHLDAVLPEYVQDISEDALVAQLLQMFEWASGRDITRRYDLQRLAEMLLTDGHALDEPPITGAIADALAQRWATGGDCVQHLRAQRALHVRGLQRAA